MKLDTAFCGGKWPDFANICRHSNKCQVDVSLIWNHLYRAGNGAVQNRLQLLFQPSNAEK